MLIQTSTFNSEAPIEQVPSSRIPSDWLRVLVLRAKPVQSRPPTRIASTTCWAVVAPSAGEEAPPVDRLGAIVAADATPGDVAAPPPDEQPASAAKNTVTKTNAPERRDVMTRMLGPHLD